MQGPWRLLRTRDPNWFAVQRAVRGAVVVPANFAISFEVIKSPQMATFAAFGSFALLLFVNFPGGRLQRAGEYAVLAVAGAGLVALGSAVTQPSWLAVLSMTIVAFVILFAGIVSSVINAATLAALLAFILSVMLPGGRAAIPDRLGGWALACAVSIPVAVFVWPPVDRDVLRQKCATMCRALSGMMTLQPAGGSDPLVTMSQASVAMRGAFRTAAARTAALSTGARLVIRLVDELQWLTSVVTDTCADPAAAWPDQARRLRTSAALALTRCAEALEHSGTGPSRAERRELVMCLADLDAARVGVADETLKDLQRSALDESAGEFERPLYAAHELGYAVALVAETVTAIAAADSRGWWARLTGRQVVMDEVGVVAAAQQVASGHLDRHSVWLQNSIRGAAGLAFAVLLARVFDAHNAFWIGLGALSVLRSNALATGATVVRALLGTAAGFVIGAAIVSLLGTGHALLWTLLPLVIFVSALAPTVISFVAGQAAFTVFSIVLFNIVAPQGWRIGVTRAEDVGLGCLASLVAGFLFWPRGAGSALALAYADAYRSAAELLGGAVNRLTSATTLRPDPAAAAAAGRRLDDAMRQYLAEQGTKRVPLESVSTLASGATRLRFASVAVLGLDGAAAPPGRDPALDGVTGVLERRTEIVRQWYDGLAAALDRPQTRLPEPDKPPTQERFLDAVLPTIGGCGDAVRAARVERLLWTGQYVGDVDRLRMTLVAPAGEVAAARARRVWPLSRRATAPAGAALPDRA
jgi:uncharacterized membrane protein YccC